MSDKPHLDSLFEAAVEIQSAAERAAFLDKSCGEDSELREQLERLLQSNEQAGGFLDNPPVELEATMIGDGSGGNLAAALDAGLAAAFQEGDVVVVGDAGNSVLKLLEQTLDKVPRVALRESAVEGAGPVVKPKSAEIPQHDADSRYRVDGEIARGGMGAVLKGRDIDLGRDLAIKVLLDQHKDKPDVVQRFVEEAQIGGQLQHPGIAPVYELGQFKDRRPFFSMKLVKGKTLSKLLAERENPASERGRFIGIFEQICQTMAYAHSRGVIHRDLKPANIMVGAFGEVQVMDWGLAKVLPAGGVADEKKAQLQQGKSVIATLRSGVGSDPPDVVGSVGSHTQMGSVMGTPAYMPPEQALGEVDQMDERSDVFGLGAILCEILTGNPPYVGTDGTAVFRQASRGKLDDCMSRLDACGADADLVALTKHCLKLEPQDRPRNGGELALKVTEYLESVETKLRETEVKRATEAARVVEARKRLRVTMALAATVLVSLSIGAASWRWVELQAIERREVATTNINSALGDALFRQTLADSANLETQVAELDQAVASAQQAVDLSNENEVESAVSNRAKTMLAELQVRQTNVKKLAEQARKDQEFKTELELIRLSQSDGVAVTVTPSAPVETRKATIVLADMQVGFQATTVDNSETAIFAEPGGRSSDAGSTSNLPETAPAPEPSLVQLFDVSAMLQRYEDAFRNSGIDLQALPVPQAPELIRSSAIQETLIGAIDNWARGLDGSTSSVEVDGLSRTKLLAIANAADDSEWRRTVRAALEKNDTAQLKELATTGEARAQSPELIAWLGAALRDGGALDRSISVLQESQRNHPGDFWLNYELGKSYVRQGQNQEGLGFARTALGIRPESPGAMIALAVASSESGRHADAMKLYRAVLARNPQMYDAHVGLGLASTHMADWDTAISAYKAAIELKPDDGELYGALALAFLSARRDVEAGEFARKGVEVDPDNAQTHIYLGRVIQGQKHESLRQDEAARMEFEKAIKLEPNNARAWYYMGYNKTHYFRDASGIDDLRTAIRLDPKFADAHASLGYELYILRSYEESLAAYEKAIESAPNSSVAYVGSMLPLVALKRFSQAVTNGRRAIILNPQDGIAHAYLSYAFQSQGRIIEAIESGRRAVELEPAADWIVEYLAAAVRAQGTSESFAIYNQILEWVPQSTAAQLALTKCWPSVPADLSLIRNLIAKHPENPQLLDGMAWWLVTHRDEQGQYQHIDEAVRWAEKASQLKPESGAILNTLGVAYYRQGQWQAAVDTLQKSQLQNGSEPSDALFLAMAYRQLGNRPQSLAHFAEAMTLRGTNTFDSETETFFSETRRLLNLKREDLKAVLAHEPKNAGATREFAEILLAEAEASHWNVLTPSEMKSEGGAKLTKLDDNSVLATGDNPDLDAYHITMKLAPQRIRAIRLEVLPDASLPHDGLGRFLGNGNFHLNEFRVLINGQPQLLDGIIVSYAEHDGYRSIIDGKLDGNHWGTLGRRGQEQFAVISTDIELRAEDTLAIELISSRSHRQHNIGRFRLSVTDEPNAPERESVRFAAMRLADPWVKLAVAWHIVGDHQALAELLQQHPEAASVDLARYLAESGKRALAVQDYSEALPQLKNARELFASLALQNPESPWTALRPSGIKSEGGATMTMLDDDSILASGTNADQDVYSILAEVPTTGVAALRLNVIPDTRLPESGSGRRADGSFCLSEISAFIMPAAGEAVPVQISSTRATFASQGVAVFDGNDRTFWSIFPRVKEYHSAVFQLASPVIPKTGDRIEVRLSFRSVYPQANLGRFRLSVTDDPNAFEVDRIHQELRESDLVGLEIALGEAHALSGQADAAVAAFHRGIDLAEDRDTRTRVLQAASAFDGILEKLAALRQTDAAFYGALSQFDLMRGQLDSARAAAAAARTLYKEKLAAEPTNPQVAIELTDLLLTQADAQHWTVLTPTQMNSEGGAALTRLGDNSILASGSNSELDAYQITTRVAPQRIRAIRLEMIPDASLPHNGPGRYPGNGNFHLNEFRVLINGVPQPLDEIIVSYAEQDSYRPVIDGTVDRSRWGVFGETGQRNSAVIATDIQLRSDDVLSFELVSSRSDREHNIGRFRLSVTDNLTALNREKIGFAAMRLSDPWEKLAAAWSMIGDSEALDELLKHHPQAMSPATAGFLAERGKSSLAEQQNNEALMQLEKARELLTSLVRNHPESKWTVLQPASITSAGGATLTELDDHSILASGSNPDKEIYEFEAPLNEGTLTAIRLEGLTWESLPQSGHGRASNGHVHLTEFEAAVAVHGESTEWRPIQFGDAWADYSEGPYVANRAIDGNPETAWYTAGWLKRENRTAIFGLVTPLHHEAGTRLRIRLRHASQYGQHAFGRFRLSVTSDPDAIAIARFHQELNESDPASLEIALGTAHAQLGQFEEAVFAFNRGIDLAYNRDKRIMVLRAASTYDGVLDKLAAMRQTDVAFQDALSRHYQMRGEFVSARTAAATARTLYQQKLTAEPTNSQVARELTDLLLSEADARLWTVLTPTEMKSRGGATLTFQPDGSVLASGTNPVNDSYRISGKPGVSDIVAIRLEALPDASLPENGPGRSPGNGNYGLNELTVFSKGERNPLTDIIVDYDEFPGESRKAIDRTVDGLAGWANAGNGWRRNTAVVATDIRRSTDDELNIELGFSVNGQPAGLGRFRLSVTADPTALNRERIRFAVLKLTDPWSKLAASYHLLGDQPALDKLLEQHPEAKNVIRDLTVKP